MAVKKKNDKIKLPDIKSVNPKTIIIAAIVLVAFCYLSVLTGSLGVVGKFIKLKLFQLIGLGSYFIPLIILINLILLLTGMVKKVKIKNIVFVYLLSMVVLLIVDMNTSSGLTLTSRIKENLLLAELNRGSGIIGSSLGYLVVKYVGKLGAYLISAVILFFSLLSFINLSIKDFFIETSILIKKLINNVKKMIDSRNTKGRDDIYVEDFVEDEEPVFESIPARQELLINNHDLKENNDKKQMSVEDFNIKIDKKSMNYKFPPLELLKSKQVSNDDSYVEEIRKNAQSIEKTMKSFKIDAKVVQVNRGPSVTCYELQPEGGVKVSSIVNLADNLALSLATSGIRIEAPIPGKSVVGIEVPNETKDDVYLKEIIGSKEFKENKSAMPLALGKDISGNPIISSIDKMPHLLIAGATGSGKSVCINTLITSILYKSSPEDVKLILIDPKMVELNVYNGVPHLVIPVVTDPKKASAALNWAVKEMDRRYTVFSENSVRDISSYKSKFKDSEEDKEDMPYIVIIIDELSDLMMVAAQEVEDHICRLAQMARACGIHLVVATQRPSVDVITGTIKANIPSRISFAVSSQIDSRTILDMAGAEKLLGKGDMLFYPYNFRKPLRVQGAFISEKEVENLVSYIKSHADVQYDKEVITDIEQQQKEVKRLEEQDELLAQAIDIVIDEGQASVSLIQRKLRVGYARAGRIIDEMESLGVVGPFEGSKPRKLLVSYNVLTEGENYEYSE